MLLYKDDRKTHIFIGSLNAHRGKMSLAMRLSAAERMDLSKDNLLSFDVSSDHAIGRPNPQRPIINNENYEQISRISRKRKRTRRLRDMVLHL